MRSFTDAPFDASSPGNQASCPKCMRQMTLTRVEPRPLGYEFRIFECASCDVEHRMFVVVDPMRSPGATRSDHGWSAE